MLAEFKINLNCQTVQLKSKLLNVQDNTYSLTYVGILLCLVDLRNP